MVIDLDGGKPISRKLSPRISLMGPNGDWQKSFPGMDQPAGSLDRKCSKSLNDLACQVDMEPLYAKGGGDTFVPRSKTLVSARSVDFDISHKLAQRCITNLLMLNAWRQQRREHKSVLEKVDGLNEKLEGFAMQVYLLRQLLNAEKNRVESATGNILELLQKIEDCEREKMKMTEINNNLREYCLKLENTLTNQENDILTSKGEAENWERQLKKEREKLKNMETEEAVLKKKVFAVEEMVAAKTAELEQLSKTQVELQNKLSSLEAVNLKLKVVEMAKTELKKAVDARDLETKQLKSIITTLQNNLQEEDEKNGILKKSILEKTNELNLLEQKLDALSKSNHLWTGGFVKMASLCAKIPVACICTVGSLLLPFPSYRI